MKLKDDDFVVNAFLDSECDVFVTTKKGYSLWFGLDEVPTSGIKSSGVKSITLKDDCVVSANLISDDKEFLMVVTDKGSAKRIRISELERQSRAKRGLVIIKEVKSNPYNIVKSFIINNNFYLGIKTESEIKNIKVTEIIISDRYKLGSTIAKEKIVDAFIEKSLEYKNSYLKEDNDDVKTLVKEEVKEDNLSLDYKDGNEQYNFNLLANEPKENIASNEVEVLEESFDEVKDIKPKKESHQISLLEIDEELRRIDEMLK